jgi:hypothetical protein
MFKKNKEAKILALALSLMLLIAAGIFLFTPNEYGHTGAQIIFSQGFWYLFWMGVFVLIALIAVVAAVRIYRKTGNANKLGLPIFIAIVFLGIAFGKGCTDKANDGVTSPAGRPVITSNK